MTFLRAIAGGLVVSASLLLSGCGGKLDDASVHGFLEEVSAAADAHDRAKVEAMLAPEFKYTAVTPNGSVSMTRAEMLDAIGQQPAADEARAESDTFGAVTIDPATNRATVAGTTDSQYNMQGRRVHVVDDNTFVVEQRDGKLVLLSIEARTRSLEIDGRKVF